MKVRPRCAPLILLTIALLLAGLACNLLPAAEPTSAPTSIPLPATPTQMATLAPFASPTPEGGGEPSPAESRLVVPAGQSVQIGILGPVTGSVADVYQAIDAGVGIAVDEYGPVSGFPVEVVSFDTQCDPGAAREAAQNSVAAARLVGVVGPACSSSGSVALSILEGSTVVAVSPSMTLTGVASSGPTVFNRVILHQGQPGAQEGREADSLSTVQSFYDRVPAPLAPESRFFSAYAYDATRILLGAIEATAQTNDAGELTLDRAALAQAVRNTEGFQGVTGTISFDEQGNRVP